MSELTSIVTAAGAMAGIGGALSLVLFGASRRFRVEEDPRIDEIQDLLPGANCGACGLAGCRAFAEALVKNPDAGTTCPVSGAEANAAIAAVLGVEAGAADRQVARLLCAGTHASAVFSAAYEGVADCLGAALMDGFARQCTFGCLGLGTCVRVCPFGAMAIEQGIVSIDPGVCTGCGKCVPACPQKVLELRPLAKPVTVTCSSHDKGAITRRACSVGCIACKKCEKACDDDAIHVVDLVAVIDAARCTTCGKCVVACPQGSIVNWGPETEVERETRLAKAQAAAEQAAVPGEEASHGA